VSAAKDHEIVADVMARVPALAKHREIGNGRSRGDPITSTGRGTSRDYLAARIKRDRPDIAARIDELPSIRAAARAARIVKSRPTLPADPATAAAVILKHFTNEQIATIVRVIQGPG
jgi:hypothetical protein